MAEKDTTKKVAAKKQPAKAATKATGKVAHKAKAPAAKKPAHTAKKASAVVVEAKHAEPVAEATDAAVSATVAAIPTLVKPSLAAGRYVFATGRRKTSIANIRLFSGDGKVAINHKSLKDYFYHSDQTSVVLKPLELTGMGHDFFFTASVSGGGINSQARAVQHGLAQALGSLGDDIRIVMKKNGFLTRDDRKKERKKPGLKRARRAPQWAKR